MNDGERKAEPTPSWLLPAKEKLEAVLSPAEAGPAVVGFAHEQGVPRCRCGRPLPVVPMNQVPPEFCSAGCKAAASACPTCGHAEAPESPLFARVEVFILQCPRCGDVSIAGTWGSRGLKPNENWRPESALWRCDKCKFRARVGLLVWDASPRGSKWGPDHRMPDDMVATTAEQNRALRVLLNRYRRAVATERVNERRYRGIKMGWKGYMRRMEELWGDEVEG